MIHVINKKTKSFVIIVFVLLSITLTQNSCKKIIEVDVPVTNVNALNVYNNDATASAVLTGIYTKLSNDNGFLSAGGFSSISLFAGLSADEIALYNFNDNSYLSYYRNEINSKSILPDYWNTIYPVVFISNSAIEGLQASTNLTPSLKQQLLGEARFIRAFCYFYLVNLYGDVPLALSTDWKVNSLLTRTSSEVVYKQVIKDLIEAQSLLSDKYLMGDAMTPCAPGAEERVRPCKSAATALLARAYLYVGDWNNAEQQATNVISKSTVYDTVPLNKVFLKNSKEAIWQIQPTATGVQSNTGEGMIFVLPDTGPNTTTNPVYLSDGIVNDFEANDRRRNEWVGSVTPTPGYTYYFPNKYKIGLVLTSTQEYGVIFRLAEQYLIRAEARAQLNKISEAQNDLNIIRKRAGLPNTVANDKNSLLSAILHERRVELFTEWGHRWFDLKRTGNIDVVMNTAATTKGGTWASYKAWFPIPQTDMNKNPKLVQNMGY